MKAKFSRRSGPELGDDKQSQLLCGTTWEHFLGIGYGIGEDCDVAAMRSDWASDSELRETICQRHRKKFGPHCECFAVLAFGTDGRSGMVQTVADMDEARMEYSRQRDAGHRQHWAERGLA